jgi:sigma-B regulation protein RsbU (phosphoserine phosphatase)
MTLGDLVSYAVGVIICVVGLSALAGHLLRPRPRDRLLLWLGAFAFCYGFRLLVAIDSFAGLFISMRTAAYVEWTINYVILIPATLFAQELYGPGWHRSIRWIALAALAYAVVGVVVNAATGEPGRVPDPALIIFAPGLLIAFALGAAAGYRPRAFPEWRILVAGFLVFLIFVVHEHAALAGLLPWNVRIEPLGVLIFIASLAYIAVGRFFSGQRQLIAIEKEMEAARQIQTSILPRELPVVAGVDLAVRYVPLAAVAGDFYDVVRLDDGGIAVLVADVSGHGVPAALVASMVKVAFVAETSRQQDPGAILQSMNATLCGMFERAYVTAVCVTIVPRSGKVRYAVAGHPPPILVSDDGVVRSLDERGMFIGIFPLATYTTAGVSIHGRARLILYTDGLTEAAKPNSNDLYGIERLSAFAARERRRPAGEFTDLLLADVTAFTREASVSHDDVTVLVLDADAS